MIRDERLAKMSDYINDHHYVSLDELVQKFQVSRATVRRDLEILGERGVVSQSRGGAIGNRKIERELLYQEKRESNAEEKARIGEYAAAMIPDDATVFLDTGTTTFAMIPDLLKRKNIHVITNDLQIGTKLAENSDIEVSVTGGKLRKGYYTLLGPSAERCLEQIYVDMAFMSFDAIDIDFGCSITNLDEITIKQIMIAHSKQTVALCDHSKFEKIVSWQVCQLSNIDIFVTGREMAEQVIEGYKSQAECLQIV